MEVHNKHNTFQLWQNRRQYGGGLKGGVGVSSLGLADGDRVTEPILVFLVLFVFFLCHAQ